MVAEFSLALTLLASGGLALKGFWNLARVDLGIRPEHVLTFQLPVPDERLKGPEQIRSYYRQMLERVDGGAEGPMKLVGVVINVSVSRGAVRVRNNRHLASRIRTSDRL